MAGKPPKPPDSGGEAVAPTLDFGVEVRLTMVTELASAHRLAWQRLWALLLQGTLASRDGKGSKRLDNVEDGGQP
jgi:hypothetical protein